MTPAHAMSRSALLRALPLTLPHGKESPLVKTSGWQGRCLPYSRLVQVPFSCVLQKQKAVIRERCANLGIGLSWGTLADGFQCQPLLDQKPLNTALRIWTILDVSNTRGSSWGSWLRISPPTCLAFHRERGWPPRSRQTRGDLPIKHSRLELKVRLFAVGLKPWLFANTPVGTQASALICSLVGPVSNVDSPRTHCGLRKR